MVYDLIKGANALIQSEAKRRKKNVLRQLLVKVEYWFPLFEYLFDEKKKKEKTTCENGVVFSVSSFVIKS